MRNNGDAFSPSLWEAYLGIISSGLFLVSRCRDPKPSTVYPRSTGGNPRYLSEQVLFDSPRSKTSLSELLLRTRSSDSKVNGFGGSARSALLGLKIGQERVKEVEDDRRGDRRRRFCWKLRSRSLKQVTDAKGSLDRRFQYRSAGVHSLLVLLNRSVDWIA